MRSTIRQLKDALHYLGWGMNTVRYMLDRDRRTGYDRIHPLDWLAWWQWPVLYVGSVWHQDCDPFVTVIATSREDCQTMLDGQAEDEFEKLCDDDATSLHGEDCSGEIDREGGCNKCDHQVEDTTRTGGVFEEQASSVELSQEQIADLRSEGITFGGD